MTIEERYAFLCKLLGIEVPIIQGGMAWTSDAALAAAVSNAGGLGVIGSGRMPTDLVVEQIQLAMELTDNPFAVNLMLQTPWIAEIIEAVIEYKVPVVTTGAGNPGPYMEALKGAGIKVLPLVSSVALAKRMEQAGADAVIGEGNEAGGHIGDLTTMVLIPQLVDAVSIPVIAAGGIADGRGMAAAFALGAYGTQSGTVFMCAEECTIHPAVKAEIIRAKDRDTVVTGRCTSHPVRVLKNRLSNKAVEFDRNNQPEEIEALGEGALMRCMKDGDVKDGSIMAGQCAAMVHEILPAADIIERMLTSFVEARR